MRGIIIFLICTSLVLFPGLTFAQNPTEQRSEAVITKVLEEKEIETDGKKHLYQKFELVTLGDSGGQIITAESGNFLTVNAPKFDVGDKVVVMSFQGPDGQTVSHISDHIRRDSLYWLFALFITVTLLVGRLRGLLSFVGMAFSFFILFTLVLPQILAGQNPVFISIIGAIFIIPVTFSLSHGLNKKTFSAIAGTLIALVITGLLANFFVGTSHLSGFASEEAGFLQAAKGGLINIQGLLLAGIIIGALGILDDITVSQASIVFQLKKVSPNLKTWDLYSKAMEVGTDHIASVINTLVLVYTGAALPLLLLFINNPHPFTEVINYEIVAEEIVRTLVSSIGLITAVPITTLITAYFISKAKG